MWIITSSAWCLSLCPGGWNGTSWKRTWKQQRCSTWQQLCEPRRTLILGHEIHLHFQASCIFTCTIGEGGCFVRECCPKGAAGDNVQGTISKLSWSCLPGGAFCQHHQQDTALAGWAPDLMGLRALLKHEVKWKTQPWLLSLLPGDPFQLIEISVTQKEDLLQLLFYCLFRVIVLRTRPCGFWSRNFE